MRALDSVQVETLEGANYSTRNRLWIGPSSGALLDLTDYFLSGVLEEGTDELINAFTAYLDRSVGAASLAPLMTSDGPVQMGHMVVFENAVFPNDQQPNSSDWMEKFRGHIRAVDPTTERMAIVCQDLGGRLHQKQIKEVRTYGSPTGVDLDVVIQQVLTDNETGVTEYAPDPSGSVVLTYQQKLETVLQATRTLAETVGDTTRYWWDDTTGTYRFTRLRPPRDKSIPDWTMRPSRYLRVTEMKQDLEDVRNDITVEFGPANDRQIVNVRDEDSIAQYGEISMRIYESTSSPIQSLTQGTAFANAALSDLSQPQATHAVEDFLLPHLEVWDLLHFEANNVHYSSPQNLAISSLRHDYVGQGVAHTTAYCRGKPSGGVLMWRKRAKAGLIDETGAPVAHPVTTHTWVQQGSAGNKILRLTTEPATSTIYYRFGDSGAWTSAPGPSVDIFVELASGDQVLQFYSVDTNGVAEPINSTQFDQDPEPEFESLLLTEPEANQLQVNFVIMDDDVVRWALWARRGALPFLTGDDGQLTNEPDPRFLRDDGPASRQPRPFHATDGTWFVVGRAYDNRGRFMQMVGESTGGAPYIEILGSAEVQAALTSVAVSLVGAAHRLTWAHGAEVDSGHRVVIRRTEGGITNEVLTLGSARPPTYEAGSVADTVANGGGYDAPVQLGTTFRHFDYEILLYDGSTYLRSYSVSIEGADYADAGASQPPTVAPNNLELTGVSSTSVQGAWANQSVVFTIELEYQWNDNGTWRRQALVQVSAGTTTHTQGSITTGRMIRFYARYVNSAGAGPWSQVSNLYRVIAE